MGSSGINARVHGSHQKSSHITMRAVLLFAIFCSVIYMASAIPSVKTSCSLQEALACNNEIQQAMDDRSHITDINTIITCINDILASTDCGKCVCDVLPFLCGK